MTLVAVYTTRLPPEIERTVSLSTFFPTESIKNIQHKRAHFSFPAHCHFHFLPSCFFCVFFFSLHRNLKPKPRWCVFLILYWIIKTTLYQNPQRDEVTQSQKEDDMLSCSCLDAFTPKNRRAWCVCVCV